MNDFALIIHPTRDELLHRYEPGMKYRPKHLVHKVLEWMEPFVAAEVKGIHSETGEFLYAFNSSILSPKNTTLPLSGSSKPDITLRSVDFPAPFGPITESKDFSSTFKLISSRALALP